MADAKRATGTNRLTDRQVDAWLKKGTTDALHDGGGLYLRRRGEGAYWSLRQVNPLTSARTWAALFPDVPYPKATLAEAREKATDARKSASGNHTDLVRDRKAALAAKRESLAAAELEASRRLTVRQLFDRWADVDLKRHVRPDGKPAGRKDNGQFVREQFERRLFPKLGDVAAVDVRKADLLAILDALKADGKMRTANVLLADMKQMFRFAADREIVPHSPIETVKKSAVGGADVERDRVLTPEEVAALAKAVPAANMDPRSELAIWLILATGMRISEAMGTMWDNIKIERDELGKAIRGTLYLPETKNGRDHTIHLSAFALRQVEGLAALRDQDVQRRQDKGEKLVRPLPWVFPNAVGDGPVCIKSFGKQLADRQRDPERRMLNRAKNTTALVLDGGRWTAHDLRRTAATFMADLGFSGDVIDECLNHKIVSKARRVYIRDRRLVDQARAFDALGQRLAAVVDGVGMGSNVVAMRQAA